MKQLLIFLIIEVAILYCLFKLIIHFMYKPKDKEKKTNKVCPETKRRLTTTELFYGRCFQCPEWQQKTCQSMIRKQTEGKK